MNPLWMRVIGYGMHLGLGGLIAFAGAGKVFGFAPPEIVREMERFGLGSRLQLIGAGEMITALLILVPVTSSLGILMMSGFWGGVICIHMAHGQDIVFPSTMLLATWIGGWLRDARTLWSFLPWSPPAPEAVIAQKPVTAQP
jgi:hypothetical protein